MQNTKKRKSPMLTRSARKKKAILLDSLKNTPKPEFSLTKNHENGTVIPKSQEVKSPKSIQTQEPANQKRKNKKTKPPAKTKTPSKLQLPVTKFHATLAPHANSTSVEKLDIETFLSSPYLVSTWIPQKDKNYICRTVSARCSKDKPTSANSLILGFKQQEKLVFQGHVLIRLLKGCIEVGGYVLVLGEWIRVYSTSSQALYFIKANAPKTNSPFNKPNLQYLNPSENTTKIAVSEDGRVEQVINNYNSVVEIVQDDSGIEKIESISSIFKSLFTPNLYLPEKFARSSGNAKVEFSHRQQISLPGFYPVWSIRNFKSANGVLNFPEPWYQISSGVINSTYQAQSGSSPALRVVVTGKKSSGKSTFTKFLAMQFLSHFDSVYYLETDIGQPDMNALGVVALHLITKKQNSSGAQTSPNENITISSEYDQIIPANFIGPSFLNSVNNARSELGNSRNTQRYQNTIAGSVFLGTTTPKEIPHKYVDAIKYLVRLYNSNTSAETSRADDRLKNCDTPSPPLLVNTHGWVKGLGLDLLADISSIVAPTHFMQMFDQSFSNNMFFLDPSIMPQSTNFSFVPTALGDYGNSSQNFRNLYENTTKTSGLGGYTSDLETADNIKPAYKNKAKYGTSTNSDFFSISDLENEENEENEIEGEGQCEKIEGNNDRSGPGSESRSDPDPDPASDSDIDSEHIPKPNKTVGSTDIKAAKNSPSKNPESRDGNKVGRFDEIYELDQDLEEYLSSENTTFEKAFKNSTSGISQVPTTEVYVDVNANADDIHIGADSDDNNEKAIPKNISSKQLNSNSQNMRLLSLTAHLYGATKEGQWIFDVPLTSRIPVSVPFKSTKIWVCDNDIDKSDIFRLLNGSLVGVVVRYIKEEQLQDVDELPSDKDAPKILQGWPENDWEWVSHAIIRAIDVDSKSFYLVLPPSTNIRLMSGVARVELGFVKGPGPMDSGLELPISVLTQGGYSKQAMKLASLAGGNGSNKIRAGSFIAVKPKLGSVDTPYLAVGSTEGIGSSDLKPKKSLKRRSQAA